MSATMKLLDDIIADLDMRARMTGEIEDDKAVLDLSNGLLVRYYALKEDAIAQKEADATGDERAAFEAAYTKINRLTPGGGALDYDLKKDQYHKVDTQDAWRLWQARAALAQPVAVDAPQFQQRVQPWMLACFGEVIAADAMERNHRFLEEALELVQACGATADEAHQLVDYVYGRPVGDKPQEVGGVMVTLAALCLAQGMDMHDAGEVELARIWTKVEQIRAKQVRKPQFGPLPGSDTPIDAQERP